MCGRIDEEELCRTLDLEAPWVLTVVSNLLRNYWNSLKFILIYDSFHVCIFLLDKLEH